MLEARLGDRYGYQSYFDTVPHAQLIARVAEQVSDGRLLSLIGMFLRQDFVKGVQRWTPTRGTPQGAVISPLLTNLYLHSLDCSMRGARISDGTLH